MGTISGGRGPLSRRRVQLDHKSFAIIDWKAVTARARANPGLFGHAQTLAAANDRNA
jgi:hypothetical protein